MKIFKEILNQNQNELFFDRAKESLPFALKEVLFSNIPSKGKVLLPDGDQLLFYLDEMLEKFSNTIFYVSFVDNKLYEKAKFIKAYSNLVVNRNSLFISKINEKFDFIFTVPPFGIKGDYRKFGYSSNDLCISQIEELLNNMDVGGKLIAVSMQGITYNVQAEVFRRNIIFNYKLNRVDSLPQKLFKTTNIQSTLLEIAQGKTSVVTLNKCVLKDSIFKITDSLEVSADELLNLDSWDIAKFQIFGDKIMRQFKSSNCQKQTLGSCAKDIFRGRSDMRTIENEKGAFVVNISDIKDSLINFSNLKEVGDDRNNRRYELEDGDILLTSRGTDVRTALFNKPDDRVYIASAGLIVIRMKERRLANFVQIFFESEIGKMLLDGLKSGSVIMNIVPAKVKELMIPLLDDEKINDFLVKYDNTVAELNRVKEEAKRMVDAEQTKLDNYYKSLVEELLK